MKIEIEIPPQYAVLIEQQAAKHGISADEIVENALKNFLEGGKYNAGK